MRTIKFRGRRTDTDDWVYGYYFKATAAQLGEVVPLASARVCHCIVSDGVKFYVIPESVGEFTGLKDRNGVEIYEGDIVNQYGFKAPGVVRFGTYQRKSFMNGDLQVKHQGWYSELLPFTDKYDITWNNHVVSLVEDEDKGFEVIGNIWENEELVKDDSE